MAKRPVFVPSTQPPYVHTREVEFDWHPGMAVSQKQKSIASLHQAARLIWPNSNLLEISSKSTDPNGCNLSAFNLKVHLNDGSVTTLENVFQASKVFAQGGPFRALLRLTPLEAKRHICLKEHGDLIGFKSKQTLWPIKPKTLFYDWVYLNTLRENPLLAEYCLKFDGFTDIEFNPARSFNCQAQSAALFVGLSQAGILTEVLKSEDSFRQLITASQIHIPEPLAVQTKLL